MKLLRHFFLALYQRTYFFFRDLREISKLRLLYHTGVCLVAFEQVGFYISNVEHVPGEIERKFSLIC
jgi:hypothetical protein